MRQSIVFIYDSLYSLKQKVFSVTLNERVWDKEKWINRFPKKIYYVSDLEAIARNVADVALFKKAVESEFLFRRREGSFFSPSDQISRLRLTPENLPDFLQKSTKQRILCNQEGIPLNVDVCSERPKVIIEKTDTEIYNVSLFIGKVNINEIEYWIDSLPVVGHLKEKFLILPENISLPFLKSIQIGTYALKEKTQLLERLKKFENRLQIVFPEMNDKKILNSPSCYPVFSITENFQYATLFFEYPGNLRIPYSNKSKQIFFARHNTEIIRNTEEENSYIDLIKKSGATDTLKSTGEWYLPSVKLNTIMSNLGNEGFELEIEGKSLHIDSEFYWDIKQNQEFISLKGALKVNRFEIPVINILTHYDNNPLLFQLPDNSLCFIPTEFFSSIRDIAREGTLSGQEILIKASNFAIVSQFIKNRANVKVEESVKEILNFGDNFDHLPPIPLPEGLVQILRDYQKKGVYWLWNLKKHGFNGILADDMGLGKTLQVLALLLKVKIPQRPSLLIAPTTLTYNWMMEIEKFAIPLLCLLHSGTKRSISSKDFLKYDLVITSYSLVRNDIEILKKIRWNYIVLDESQAIKNPGTQINETVCHLQSNSKLCLSGTPVENSPLDLWSHFNFLMPGFLDNLNSFKKNLAIPNALQELNLKTRPYILRRLKSQVCKELPPKTEITLFCEMYDDQKEAYINVFKSGKKQMDQPGLKANARRFHIFELLLRLRQVACHPLLTFTEKNPEWKSGKLSTALEMADEIISEGHKILIFSQFTSLLKIFRKHFQEHGIQGYYLDGQTQDRMKVINGFKKEKKPCVFFISLKTGGTGLNLTEANYVFLLDPWWNPASENQAIDRTHRIGQSNPVTVYRFISKETIEEKIQNLQKNKKHMEKVLLTASDLQHIPDELLEELLVI